MLYLLDGRTVSLSLCIFESWNMPQSTASYTVFRTKQESKVTPVHTCFNKFSFFHFNLDSAFPISRALRLKNDDNSLTHFSLSAILIFAHLETGSSLPYLASSCPLGRPKYCVLNELLFRNVLKINAWF